VPALFCYGTLQQRDVQLANFGRELEGLADVLIGYRLMPLAVSDRRVLALSGQAVHWIARASGNPADRIAGLLFELSDAELVASDEYEVADYSRVEATLESRCRAWVYTGRPLAA
jgi:hypothetical protein